MPWITTSSPGTRPSVTSTVLVIARPVVISTRSYASPCLTNTNFSPLASMIAALGIASAASFRLSTTAAVANKLGLSRPVGIGEPNPHHHGATRRIEGRPDQGDLAVEHAFG